MRTVWKYTFTNAVMTFAIPAGARILVVQMQGALPQLWAEVDTLELNTTRTFVLVGTGNEVPLRGVYVGTVQDDHLVFHVYEVPS